MSEINIPNIQTTNIRNINIPYARVWLQGQPYIPNFNPITNYIGFPIVDMPGCVEMHKDNRRDGKPWDRDLVNQDPKGSTTLCPNGHYPSYSAMNYEPEQLIIQREQEAPPIASPPEPPPSPETPDTSGTGEGDPACPGPLQPRLGTLGPNEKEKVSGYELQRDPSNTTKKICVVLYEDIGPVEQYLPSAQIASTTAVIATVAGASALLAKPLADLLLRVFKPAIKTALTKINKLRGKETYKPTRQDIMTDEYRKKKELPPLKRNTK